ncbi:hypothetical protein CLAIMM_14224 [Cladophialophora immunda]|nr:hypothetical protein CLAIMM_14224 [Cladophialophora immunda]
MRDTRCASKTDKMQMHEMLQQGSEGVMSSQVKPSQGSEGVCAQPFSQEPKSLSTKRCTTLKEQEKWCWGRKVKNVSVCVDGWTKGKKEEAEFFVVLLENRVMLVVFLVGSIVARSESAVMEHRSDRIKTRYKIRKTDEMQIHEMLQQGTKRFIDQTSNTLGGSPGQSGQSWSLNDVPGFHFRATGLRLSAASAMRRVMAVDAGKANGANEVGAGVGQQHNNPTPSSAPSGWESTENQRIHQGVASKMEEQASIVNKRKQNKAQHSPAQSVSGVENKTKQNKAKQSKTLH